jgi:hypothetical protein
MKKELQITRKIIIPELEEAARNYVPKYRPWLKEEDEILQQYYNHVSPETLVKYFGRSKHSIRSHACDLGLAGKKSVRND